MTTTTSSRTTRTRTTTRTEVALGLGANLGDPRAALRRAVQRLDRWVEDSRVSSLYLTAPRELEDQPPFLNAVLLGRTILPPEGLLRATQELERAAGRRPGERFGPRPLDIDLLVFGTLQRRTPNLTVPHRELRNRRFVLAPLAEVAPDLPLPPDGLTAAAALAALATRPDGGGAVQRIEDPGWAC